MAAIVEAGFVDVQRSVRFSLLTEYTARRPGAPRMR
jgi:hypothetical protein